MAQKGEEREARRKDEKVNWMDGESETAPCAKKKRAQRQQRFGKTRSLLTKEERVCLPSPSLGPILALSFSCPLSNAVWRDD